MARKTDVDRDKVTMMIPKYLLQLADMQAEVLGVDRYDVIRMAIGQGLVVLQLNEELQKDPRRYAAQLKAVTEGKPDAYESLQNQLADDAVAGVKSKLESRKEKA